MALDDAGLDSALDALFGSIHDSPTAQTDLSNALKNYAASATLSVPASGIIDPNGVPVSGLATATPTFNGSSLDSALSTLFSGNRSRTNAAAAVVSMISDYALTATCPVVGSGTFVGSQGPVSGSASASAPTFDTATFQGSINAIFAQDNSAAFAAAALSSAIKTLFKSGRMPVPATGYVAPIAVTFAPGPCTGTATGSIT